MKKILFLILPVLILTGCSYKIVKEEQNQNLKAPANNQQQIYDLDLQAKCANFAKQYITKNGYTDADLGVKLNYTNHFNTKLNKCFVLLTTFGDNHDSLFIDLFDAVEGKHYAQYNGHSICDVTALALTNEPQKCRLDSGNIWTDGNDTKNPSDFTVGFQGLINGPGVGDENTQKKFMEHIQPFMND